MSGFSHSFTPPTDEHGYQLTREIDDPETGASLMYCYTHVSEYCPFCMVDYSENNEREKQEARIHRRTGCAAKDCLKTGLTSCAACTSVKYCSAECQKAHWKSHKAYCKKQIAAAEAKAAEAKATKKCAANGCLKKGASACSACRSVSYCSKECQKAHWKEHKQTCRAAAAGGGGGGDGRLAAGAGGASAPARASSSEQTFTNSCGSIIQVHEIGSRCRMSAERQNLLAREGKTFADPREITLLILAYNEIPKECEDAVMCGVPEYICCYEHEPNERFGVPAEDVHQDYSDVLEEG